LSVDEDPNYFVGESGLWVHNCTPCTPSRENLVFVAENLGQPTSARKRIAQEFESATPGAHSDVESRSRMVPALRYTNPSSSGAPYVKFDGYRELDDGTIELIDAKTRLVPYSTSSGPMITPSVRDSLMRHSAAIEQNQGFKAVIELPNEAARAEANLVLESLGINNIETRVREE
jgi:hypothetical protein